VEKIQVQIRGAAHAVPIVTEAVLPALEQLDDCKITGQDNMPGLHNIYVDLNVPAPEITLLGMRLYTDDEDLRQMCTQGRETPPVTHDVLEMRWPGLIDAVIATKRLLEQLNLQVSEVHYRQGAVYCVTPPEFGRRISDALRIGERKPGR